MCILIAVYLGTAIISHYGNPQDNNFIASHNRSPGCTFHIRRWEDISERDNRSNPAKD